MDIKALAEKYNDYIIERRRYYHTCPELSDQEKETRASIRKDLEAMGITDIKEMEHCYGMLAKIHGGKPGKTVALRADIDALPVEEETGLPFASKNPGVMHACGHDNHIAMLLGAAKILNDVKDELEGDVVLLWQPSEETGHGAKYMLNENALDGIDAIYGCHIWGNFDAPKIDISYGRRMAAYHVFKIVVEGVSAHGSAPNLGKDAIAVSAAIINNLQQIVSRQNDPLDPLVITIGTINGGQRNNIIAKHVEMEGCVRTFQGGTVIEDRIRKIVQDTAETFGAKADLAEYTYNTTPIINNEQEITQIAHDAIVSMYGEDAIGVMPTVMASEDFSWYLDRIPGIFTFLGSRNPDKGYVYTNHNAKYDVDEDVLHRGSACMAKFAADYLAKAKK